MRIVQNNRFLRLAAEGQDDDSPLPELVSIAQLTKRTQEVDADADSAEWLAMKAIVDAPIPGMRQNEGMPDFNRFRDAVARQTQRVK